MLFYWLLLYLDLVKYVSISLGQLLNRCRSHLFLKSVRIDSSSTCIMRSFLFDKGMDAGELVGGGHVEGGLMCAGPLTERCLLVIVATCHRPTALRASVRDLHSDVRT